MNTAQDILAYAQQHKIHLAANNGKLILEAPDGVLTDEFLESAKQHKTEILNVITERWDPELAADGFVWCMDCQHFNGVNCNHTDNQFHTVAKQPLAPRICHWFEEKDLANE